VEGGLTCPCCSRKAGAWSWTGSQMDQLWLQMQQWKVRAVLLCAEPCCAGLQAVLWTGAERLRCSAWCADAVPHYTFFLLHMLCYYTLDCTRAECPFCLTCSA
jgi:hypothetical protein